jgi:nucleoside-diphosphate-sugar epimerase
MILVTGAKGFLGTHLVRKLRAAGQDVVALERAAEPRAERETWFADLSNAKHLEFLAASAKAKPEAVVHLAGRIDIALRPEQRQDVAALNAANVAATENLLAYCARVGAKHLIYSSSQTVYGMPDPGPITESSPCRPLEHYAKTKLEAENLLKRGPDEGVAVTVLRIPGLYSESRAQGAVYQFCLSAARAHLVRVQAEIPIPFDVLHVDDAAAAIEAAIKKGGSGWSCYNVATGEPCSLELLAEAVATLVPGCRLEKTGVPQPIVLMDSKKAARELGWTAVARSQRLAAMLEHIRHA